jgi:RES domain-containing protein
MRHHPDSPRLAEGIARCEPLAVAWEGTVFCSASVRYANRDDFLTGAGAKGGGARWNAADTFASVYTSLTPETATLEALAHFRHYGLPDESALPRVLAAARVVLQRVLDVTDAKVRRTLRVSRADVLDADGRADAAVGREALSQAVGRLAWTAKWEGLLVPSEADPRGTNLIVFPGNLDAPRSYLVIVNRDQLPPHPAS